MVPELDRSGARRRCGLVDRRLVCAVVRPSHTTQIGCAECDLLVTIDPLASGERASCPRCGHLLTENTEDGLTRSLALALAAALLLVMSMTFPFLSLQANGLEQVMTLPRSAYELYRDGFLTVAILVMGPIIVIPAMMIGALVALLLAIRRGKPARWLVPTGRFLFFLNPWSMVEVFVIGVLVSLVKIGAMATVITGISFWAYIGFVLCFTAAVANLDRFQVWREIEACQA
jgi:paraquat-inducible protein A